MLFKDALLADGSRQDILTANGKIKKIGSRLDGPGLDCSPYLLMTGMVDAHVHLRDPGFPHKETAETGTKAALRGGVTSIIDMPNTMPLCTTPEALAQKKLIYEKASLCNYGFHLGGDARDNSALVAQASGFCSLKIFLNESTGHMLVTDEGVLDRLFASSHFVSVHAEGDAVDRALYYAQKHGTSIYLCHISLEEELIRIRKAKGQKITVYAEATPHHVLFDSSQESPLLTMKPRLRSLRDRQKLLEALDEGLIDTWGTDHAPHRLDEKEAQTTYGVEGLEFALENLITLAKEMGWTMAKVQDLYSAKPSEIFRIQGKGLLQEGADADFVLVDRDAPYTVSSEDIVSLCGWSPYTGRTMGAKIHATYIGGVCAFDGQSFQRSPHVQSLDYSR